MSQKRLETLGIYAGSFAPFHKGHMDIVDQALKVFDKVMVARGINPQKDTTNKYPLPLNTFSKYPNLFVEAYNGLLTNLIYKMENLKFNVTIVRGLRSGADLEYEQNFSAFLKSIDPDVKIVAFYCNANLRHVSSSALRDIKVFSDEIYYQYAMEH